MNQYRPNSEPVAWNLAVKQLTLSKDKENQNAEPGRSKKSLLFCRVGIPIDSYAIKVVSEEFHDGRPVTAADVEAAFARFGEWKGMAFWFWDYGSEE